MAFKQPRVPQESGRALAAYVRKLGMFLRDFCMASWNADRMKDAEIEKIKKRLDARKQKCKSTTENYQSSSSSSMEHSKTDSRQDSTSQSTSSSR